jgi:hypothetical protein
MTRRIYGLCLMMMLLAGGGAAARQGGAGAPASKGVAGQASPASAPPAPDGVQELRRAQLRLLREGALSRVVEGIKAMDEAALRISARNQLLEQLGGGHAAEDRALAAQLASDALTDFGEHAEEIPPFMADYLFSDLAAWIQKHQPGLAERLQAAEKNRKGGKESDRIRALLQMKDGGALAAQRLRQLLAEGQEVEGLVFFLDELKRGNPKEFEPLLSRIVEAAGRGQVSFQTLFWVSDVFLRPDVPASLRRGFLTAVVARTQPANFAAEPAPQVAYELLNKVLPFVRESDPEMYARAVAQSFNLRASFDERQLAAEARAKRLSQSQDPFADLLAEAEATRSKGERNELLADAARLALEQKRFAQCLEAVAKLDPAPPGASPDFWRNWADQFLKGFVKVALAAKDAGRAEEGAGRIASPLAHAESVALLMRFRARAGDRSAAQRLLDEAVKRADRAPDNLERAKAFLLLSLVAEAADESAPAGLLESAVKALNGLPRPDPNAGHKKPYQQYVRGLDNTGYQLVRSFRELTKKDEVGVLALSEKLDKPDLRTLALIGVFQGLNASLAAAQ